MVRRPGFLLFVAPGSHSLLQRSLRCGRIGGMDDRANRVVARPPNGSVNNQPAYSVLDLEMQVFMAMRDRRDGWMDQPLGPVAITGLVAACAAFVVFVVTSCPVR